MAFQPAFNARLIAEVQKHPCLYNHSRRGSGDTMERQRLWESIAQKIDGNCTAEFAKKRWLQLRDRYRKELKIAIKNDFASPVRWCYFAQLSWLDPYLKDNISSNGVYIDEKSKNIKMESIEDSPSFSNLFDFSCLANVKNEMDETDDSDPALESSVLDRLLASAQQRMQSTSPESATENDSGRQSSDCGEREVDERSPSPRMTTACGAASAETVTPNTSEINTTIRTTTEEQKTNNDEPKNNVAAAIEAAAKRSSVDALIAANQARFAQHLAAQFSGIPHAMLSAAKRSETAATPAFFPEQQTQASTTPIPHTPMPNYPNNTTKDYKMRQNNRQTTENIMKMQLQQVGRAAIEWLNDEDLLYSRIVGLKLKKMDPKKRKKVRAQIMALLEESEEVDHDDTCSSHSQSAKDNEEDCHIDSMDVPQTLSIVENNV